MLELDIDENLCLEALDYSHARAIFGIINKNREYLRRWLTFVDSTNRLEDTETYINGIIASANRHDGEMIFVMKYKDNISGLIGLKKVDWANKIGEVGYWIDERYQGRGIVTCCCRRLITHAFDVLGFNRIEIKCGVGNFKSEKIPYRLGFTLEGIEREGELVNDTFIDINVFSLLKKEWSVQLMNGYYHENSFDHRSLRWNWNGVRPYYGLPRP